MNIHKQRFKTLEQRFWEKVDKRGKNECWEWMASYKNKHKYGSIWFNNKVDYAHRVSWILHNGEIPKGKHVLHKCDNPPCVNPDHLFIGTRKDNMQDAVKKGRHKNNPSKGKKHWNAKITEEVVRIIRELYKRPDLSHAKIAKEFNLSETQTRDIIIKKSWKHVN